MDAIDVDALVHQMSRLDASGVRRTVRELFKQHEATLNVVAHAWFQELLDLKHKKEMLATLRRIAQATRRCPVWADAED